MRHGTPSRRSRNRGPGRNKGASQRSQVFDSNGPDVRIRGTAHQIVEKYMALAKDAASSGDRVLSESYMQHAEHYQRIIGAWEVESPREQPSETMQKQDDDLGLPESITRSPQQVAPEKEMSDA